MAWQDKISGCFGQVDLEFAGHPNETERAADLLTTVLNVLSVPGRTSTFPQNPQLQNSGSL